MEFRKECFVNLKLCACDRKYAKCRTKADAQDKMGFQYISINVYIVRSHARIRRRDRGPDPPPPPPPPPPPNEKSQKIQNFLAILDQIPWNSQNFQASIQRWASETPFKGVSLAGQLWPAFSDILDPLSLKKEEQFGSRSDPNGIQERMFRQFKHLAMRLKACKASILSNIRLCRAKAGAHEKRLQAIFSALIHDIFRDYKRFVCKRWSLSLSLFQSLQIVWIQKISDVLPNKIRGKQDTKN